MSSNQQTAIKMNGSEGYKLDFKKIESEQYLILSGFSKTIVIL